MLRLYVTGATSLPGARGPNRSPAARRPVHARWRRPRDAQARAEYRRVMVTRRSLRKLRVPRSPTRSGPPQRQRSWDVTRSSASLDIDGSAPRRGLCHEGRHGHTALRCRSWTGRHPRADLAPRITTLSGRRSSDSRGALTLEQDRLSPASYDPPRVCELLGLHWLAQRGNRDLHLPGQHGEALLWVGPRPHRLNRAPPLRTGTDRGRRDPTAEAPGVGDLLEKPETPFGKRHSSHSRRR